MTAISPPGDREQLLDIICETLNGNITVTDVTGKILYVNQKSADTFRRSKEELIGMLIQETVKLGFLDSSAAEKVIATGQQVLIRNTNNDRDTLITSGIPIYDEEGKIHRILVYSQQEYLVSEFADFMEMERAKLQTALKYRDKDKNVEIVAVSNNMRKVLKTALNVAKSTTTVILYGESGTGKEILSRYIHRNSARSKNVFIPVNCAAVPHELMESEFFGYSKGAFTGASKDGKPGLFEICDNGTLFLDEIGELPLAMQSKFLRVLENGEIKRVGDTIVKNVDVRIIAATNRNLKQMIQDGTFREDFYYRLNVIPIHIPPLRDRPQDLEILTQSFLDQYNQKHRRNRKLTAETMQAFREYFWPGNIRELRNFVERMVITPSEESLEFEDTSIPQGLIPMQLDEQPLALQISDDDTLKDALSKFEKQHILRALNGANGNISVAAEALGVHPSGLYKKIGKYGIRKRYGT